MFRKGLSRFVTLLPDLKISVSVAPAILPVLCGDPGPQGSRFRGSGGRLEAHGQGCLRCLSGQTQLPSP